MKNSAIAPPPRDRNRRSLLSRLCDPVLTDRPAIRVGIPKGFLPLAISRWSSGANTTGKTALMASSPRRGDSKVSRCDPFGVDTLSVDSRPGVVAALQPPANGLYPFGMITVEPIPIPRCSPYCTANHRPEPARPHGWRHGVVGLDKVKKTRGEIGKNSVLPIFPGDFFFCMRRARDSNPQPLAGYLSSNEAAHQFAYPPTRRRRSVDQFGAADQLNEFLVALKAA